MLPFTYRIGYKLLALPPDCLASVHIPRLAFMDPYIQYFCYAQHDHPPINTSMWCLEGISNKRFHLPSPPSQEVAAQFIQLLRPNPCNHTYLPFSHIPAAHPSVKFFKMYQEYDHSATSTYHSSSRPWITEWPPDYCYLFPESKQNNLFKLKGKLSHSSVQTTFHRTL